jgi:two-component sensor histidine kinase
MVSIGDAGLAGKFGEVALGNFLQRAWRGELRPGLAGGFAIGIGCVIAAILVRLALDAVAGPGSIPSGPFYPAVLVATLFGGAAAGEIATLATLAALWWLLAPLQPFGLPPVRELADMAIYAATLLLVVWVANHYRRLKRDADLLVREKAELAERLAEDVNRRRSAEEKLMLTAQELEHRTNNMLATVKGLTRLTRADTVSGFIEALNNRLDALGRTHALLSKSRWQGTELKRLIGDELSPYAAGPEKRVEIGGPDLSLSVAGAESFAMVIHELTTNAVKYGALSRPNGRLKVEWSQPARNRVHIDWLERGAQIHAAPSRTGFGTRAIKTIVEHQLSGKVEFGWQPDGLHCRMEVPAERLTGDV